MTNIFNFNYFICVNYESTQASVNKTRVHYNVYVMHIPVEVLYTDDTFFPF